MATFLFFLGVLGLTVGVWVGGSFSDAMIVDGAICLAAAFVRLIADCSKPPNHL